MGDMPDNPGRPRCAHVRHARQPRPTPLRPCPTCPTSSPATLQPCPTCPTTPADPAAPMSDMPDKLAGHVAAMSDMPASSPTTLQACRRRPTHPPSRPPSCANSWQQFNIIPIGYAQAPVPEVVPPDDALRPRGAPRDVCKSLKFHTRDLPFRHTDLARGLQIGPANRRGRAALRCDSFATQERHVRGQDTGVTGHA